MTMSNDMLISKRLKFPTNTSLQLLKILDGVATYTLTSGLKRNGMPIEEKDNKIQLPVSRVYIRGNARVWKECKEHVS